MCVSECPAKWKQLYSWDVPMALHCCDVPGRHQCHHCAGCGSWWEENMNLKAARELRQLWRLSGGTPVYDLRKSLKDEPISILQSMPGDRSDR